MAKPKLALIPAAQGDKFYSVLPSSGVGDFDFTRSGGATRINSQGLIETVADGVSRLNYPMIDGKVVGCPSHLLEPASTNLFTYSEDFAQSYWAKGNVGVTSNNAISPDGTLNADKLFETSGNGVHLLVNNAITTNGLVTGSIYSKYLSRYLRLTIHNSNNANEWYSVIYDLENGTIYDELAKTVTVFNCEIKQMPNDYYRCIITADLGLTSSTVFYIQTSNGASINLGDDRGRGQYQGDGTSGIYIWGAMLEQQDFVTSYIPTTTSATTRSAETANNSGDASTFNDSEGVLMAEISALGEDTNYELISISDGTNDIHIDLGFNNSTTESYKQAKFGVDNLFGDFTDPIADQTTPNKMAIKYKSGDSCFYVNGFKIDSSSTAFTPTSSFNELKFSYFTGADNFYGNTKQLQYYDTALTDSELETLTSWVSFSDMAEGQLYTIE